MTAPKKAATKTTLWDFLTNTLIAAMNKGQLVPLLIGFIILFSIWRMPSEKVSELAFAIFESLKAGQIYGWIFFAVTLGMWFAHAKWQRRTTSAEIDRISQERNRLQASISKAVINSSKAGQGKHTQKTQKG